MNQATVKINRVTVGKLYKRTLFDAWVDGMYVGRYPTMKEAEEKAQKRIENNERYWDSLGSEFDL